MALEAEVVIRSHQKEDINCLLSNWGNSYYYGSVAHLYMTTAEFHSFHRPIRERYFDKENIQVLVCASNDDPWLILGWIATESVAGAFIFHYIYVKDAFRGRGIARLLMDKALPARPVIYTHLTEKGKTIRNSKYEEFNGFIYIPNLV